MAIPRRERLGHKCLRSCAPVNSYDLPRAMHPTSQHPHRRGTAASHCTTDKQPNRSTYPDAKTGHAEATCCPDAHTTAPRPPYAGTRHDRPGPGRHHRSPSQHDARIALIYPLTHSPTSSRRGPHSANPITTTTHTHSPHPKTPTQASLPPTGREAHLQSMRLS